MEKKLWNIFEYFDRDGGFGDAMHIENMAGSSV